MKAKRFLSILLLFCMLICVAPPEAYALVGASQTSAAREDMAAWRIFEDYNGYNIYCLNNRYIRFYFLTSKNSSNKNNYMVTLPARTEASGAEAYDMVFNKGIYQRVYFTIDSKEVSFDTRSVETASVDTSSIDEATGMPVKAAGIKTEYTIGGGKYKICTNYYITKLDAGTEIGFSAGGMIGHDENDKGRTWGIRSVTSVGYVNDPPMYSRKDIKVLTEMKGFNRMGHENAPTAASLYMNTAVGTTNHGFTNTPTAIPGAMSRTHANKVTGGNQNEAITEIMTRGYTWANPFTATSGLYCEYVDGYSQNVQINRGHEYGYMDYDAGNMPEYFSTTSNGDVILENASRTLMGLEVPGYGSSTLWGFRGLYATNEKDFTPNDNVTIKTSARHLGIYKDGDGYKAVPAKSENELKTNKKSYGEPIAVLRGDYKEEGDRYKFTTGVAALSSTVTAVWNLADGGLSVGKDGSIEANHVSLNTTTFKFYQEKNQSGNDITMEPRAEGINVTIDASNNAALMAIDIPNTTVKPDGAVIKPDGNIKFTGEVEFQLFPGADFNIEELGYGLKNGKFKMNGIKATGKIDTADMIGLDMAKVEGEIDTFKSYYHFTMELNVFDLFESNAELELKRSKLTGSLMPNKLYFYAGSNLAKIPLTPPVIVAYIKGAGGGFDRLADTFNGDFFAIPPIQLTITGKGEILNVMEAKASYTFGPAYYKIEAEDVGISFMKKLNLIDKFSMYEGLQGETRNYSGKNYTGIKAMGGASVHVSVPEGWEVIQAQGDINASVFAGLDSYKAPTGVYIAADLSGGVRGSLHLPKDWGAIGGLKLGSTGFDFYLGANTMVPVRGVDFGGAVNKAFKNFKVYGGLKKEADWKVVKYRVYYIFPENNAGFTIKPFWSKLPEWDWADHKPSGYSAVMNEEDGTLAVMSLNMDELNTAVVNNADESGIAAYSGVFSKDVELKANAGQTLSSDATVLMMLTPNDANTDINAFADSITVSKGGSAVTLTKPIYNENEEITNEKDINMYTSTNADGKNCVLIGLGENANIGDKWNVTSTLSDFSASLNASAPFDSLDVSLSGYNISGSVKNAEDGAEYVLATYFGSEKGKSEYLIEQSDVNDVSNISLEIPKEGTMLPTGKYNVTASLLKKETITVTNDETGETETQTVLLPVDRAEFDNKVPYKNTLQPNAPASVSLTAVGNEIMQAEWNEVENAEGYQIKIYQKDDNGELTDTSKGYDFSADDIKKIKDNKYPGVTYDSTSKTFRLDMAMTVGGTDIEYDGNENKTTTEKANQNAVLEANKTYAVGVSAYNCVKDEENNNINKANSKVNSEEKKSNETLLPEYTPIDIDVTLKTLRGSEYVEHAVEKNDGEDGSGVYTTSAGNGDDNTWYIGVSNKNNVNADYTITRVDNNDKYIGAEWGYINSYIDGSVMFRIDAKVNKGIYTDTTTKYLMVELDNTAPMLSLDKNVVYADEKTGKYQIGGITEPNAAVCIEGKEGTATADANGRFTYEGQLELTIEQGIWDEEGNPVLDKDGNHMTETIPNPELDTGLVRLYATDVNGNESAAAQTVITLGSDPDKNDDGNGGGRHTGGGGGGRTTRFTVKFDSNGGSNVSSQTVVRNNSVTEPAEPTKEGFKFNGWYLDKDLTEKYDFSERVTKDITLYAAWTEKQTETSGEWKNPFDDVKSGDWFFEDVKYAAENGLMKGTSETMFEPNGVLTRAMLVTILYRADGEPNVGKNVRFSDVDPSAYYADAVVWAQQNGIVFGVTETEFAPEANITREQIAAIMFRYAKYKGYDISAGENTNILSYDDFGDVSEYAIESLQYAVGSGIIKGRTESTLNPKDSATRAEAAAILGRFLKTEKK